MHEEQQTMSIANLSVSRCRTGSARLLESPLWLAGQLLRLLGCLLLAGCLQAQIKGVVQGLDSTQTKPLKNVKITL